MVKIMKVLPLVAAFAITVLPGIASAEETTQPCSSVEAASAETQSTPVTQNETKIAEVALLPSEVTPIEGKAEKKQKSALAKVGSFMANLLFSGDYPDGYTSFTAF